MRCSNCSNPSAISKGIYWCSTATCRCCALRPSPTCSNGRYAPKNIGAVWVETSGGQFVKTVERWAAAREQYLYKWKAASGGWAIAFFGTPVPDQMDVISGATLNRHQAHNLTWNLKDANGNAVPEGDYRLMIEVTDHESQGDTDSIPFTLGPGAQVVNQPGKSPHSGVTITP